MTPEARRFKLICRAHWLARGLFTAAAVVLFLFTAAIGFDGWVAWTLLINGSLILAAIGLGWWRYRADLREANKIEEDYGLDGWPRVR